MKEYDIYFGKLNGFSCFFEQITVEKINQFMLLKPTNESAKIGKWLDYGIECKKIGYGDFYEFTEAHFDVERSYLLKCIEEGLFSDKKNEIKNKVLHRLCYDSKNIVRMKSFFKSI